MINVTIIGACGYAGGELLRLLLQHPQVEITHLLDTAFTGQDVASIFPYLQGFIQKEIEDLPYEKVAADSDVIFMATPHGQGIAPAIAAVAAGKKLIDIGTDFRFRDVAVYEKWYGVKHTAAELSAQAIYALPEFYRDQIKSAKVVANPGCYPTASLLALYPLLKEGLVEPGTIIIDAKSGTSGAGRKPAVGNLFAECGDSFKAYGVATHRHTPEIEQEIAHISGIEQTVSFTPHLLPMIRGIHATVYANLRLKTDGETLTKLYRHIYQNEYFVRVHEHGEWPQTKWASGTNLCHLAVTYDPRTGRAIVCSVIDNIGKGAAGQAIQNMNILFDLPEQTGLQLAPMYP